MLMANERTLMERLLYVDARVATLQSYTVRSLVFHRRDWQDAAEHIWSSHTRWMRSSLALSSL